MTDSQKAIKALFAYVVYGIAEMTDSQKAIKALFAYVVYGIAEMTGSQKANETLSAPVVPISEMIPNFTAQESRTPMEE